MCKSFLLQAQKNRLSAVSLFMLFHQPASHPMARAGFFEFRLSLRTLRHSNRTTCMESATLRRIKRAGHIPFQDGTVTLDFGMRNRDGRHQSLCIRMQWFAIKRITSSEFNHLAKIHNRHTVGDVFHHAQVMRDEKISKAEFLLQIFENVQNL